MIHVTLSASSASLNIIFFYLLEGTVCHLIPLNESDDDDINVVFSLSVFLP
jgi:hypothetical protein